jgi:ABC-type nitrate/sulfonate/bicarbonate transport system ATPase subunit
MRRISLERFSLSLGTRNVFRNVDSRLEWGKSDSPVIALMGPSGSGKTSLVRAIVNHRYLRPVPGIGIAPDDVVLASVPQVPVLFPHLDARANARLFRAAGRYRSLFDDALFESLVETLRMEAVLRDARDVSQLSGGEAQRLMLIRTLSIRPDLLTLDEPCTGLDSSVRESFLVDLLEAVERLDLSLLYVSHHWSEISSIAGRVAYLRVPRLGDGAVEEVLLGSTVDFAKRPPTVDAFESVYGLGTSVWPVVPAGTGYRLCTAEEITAPASRVACFRPVGDGSEPCAYQRAGPFRLARGLLSLALAPAPSAWVYHDGDLEAVGDCVEGRINVG